MIRRSTLEITLEVLNILRNVNAPTKIMYKANLSWAPLMRVLVGLIEQGLVVKRKPTGKPDKRRWQEYYLTQKGKDALQYFSTFQKDFGEIAGFKVEAHDNRN